MGLIDISPLLRVGMGVFPGDAAFRTARCHPNRCARLRESRYAVRGFFSRFLARAMESTSSMRSASAAVTSRPFSVIR